jgi:hypothetical protein
MPSASTGSSSTSAEPEAVAVLTIIYSTPGKSRWGRSGVVLASNLSLEHSSESHPTYPETGDMGVIEKR